MRKTKSIRLTAQGFNVLRIGFCSLVLSTLSHALTYTWDGTDNPWNTAHWSDGTNTVVGPTTPGNTAIINAGTVKLYTHDMFGNGGGATSTTAIQINSGGTVDTNNTTNPIVGLTLNGGSLLINGGHSSTYGGVRLSGTLTAGGSAASTISSTGDLTKAWIGVGNNGVKDLTLSVADVTGDSAVDLTISSAMVEGNWGGGPHGVIKTGAGMAKLNGTNTYLGETKVQVGTLLLESSNTGSGLVTISDGAKLGGNGSTTSAVTIQTGGKLGVDISDWTGAAGSGFTDLQIGSLNCAGTWVVHVTSASGYANFSEAAKTFAFLKVTGSSNFNPANVTVVADGFTGAGTWSVRQVGNTLELVYAAGGDPRTTTTTELVSSLNPSTDGDPVTFTATVKAGAAIATDAGNGGGTVEFRVDGNLVTTDSFVNGVATYSTNTLTPGSHSIIANYTGDETTYKPSAGNLTQVNKTPYLLTFNFGSYGAATINGLNITKTVPYLTNPATLPAATYTLTDGATCTPASGAVQNFSEPVEYTVKSADETITKVYTVTVTVAPAPVYTWQGGAGNWSSANWQLNDGSVALVAGPTGTSNVPVAVIDSGTVTFAANDTFGMADTPSSPVVHVNNATLSSGGFNTIWNLNLDGGIIRLNGGAAEAYPAFQLAGTLTAAGTSSVIVGAGSNNKINLGGNGNATLTIDTPDLTDSFTVNGPLKNSPYGGSLTKTGAGTLTLAAGNYYTGATRVSNGSLILNGTNTGGGALTVAANARLGGSGSTTSAVTVEDGGKLLANITNWSAGTGDVLTVGALTLSGAWSLDVSIDAFTEADKVVAFLTTSGITGYTAPVAINGPGNGTWAVRQNSLDFNTLELVYTAGAAGAYDAWKAGPFANEFTESEPDQDPDGDGMTNQQEFAFGLDPTLGSSANPIAAALKPDGTFSFTRYAASGLRYTVWTSEDLQTWTEDADAQQKTGTPNEAGVATVNVALSSPPAGSKLFVRVAAD